MPILRLVNIRQDSKIYLYKVTWSPFCPDIFLSCSSDWTIYLWRQDLPKPVEGKVEIWDLRVSGLDPTIVSMTSPGVNPTALLCTPETDCVLVGDSEGQVTVYKLKNLPAGGSTQVKPYLFSSMLFDLCHTPSNPFTQTWKSFIALV
uniref:WD repeat domain 78 n=1 Tax=Sinocyclocheilus grahami TaxID=75366 RepID=A0A672M0X1_SINGR